MRPLLRVKDDVPPTVAQILQRAQGVEVQLGARRNALKVDHDLFPARFLTGDPQIFTPNDTRGELRLVAARYLTPRARTMLEEKGLGYVDSRGATHIDMPGAYVHVVPGADEPSIRVEKAPPGVGVVAVRAVQHLLSDVRHDWSVIELAKIADCAAGQAQNLFRRLETEGLVATVGRNRERTRHVTDPTALLDWLATVPAARRRRERLHIYVYGRDLEAVVRHLLVASTSAPKLAVTGAAAAALLGAPVTTTVNTIMVRVDPDFDLLETARLLGGNTAEAGANVVLVRDTGRLATQGMRLDQPLPVASEVRVYLDMLDERRGEDAAALFREQRIGF